MHCLPLVLLTLLGGEQTLDDFSYANTESARQIWSAGEGTTPVEMVAEEDRPVMKITAPFDSQTKLTRAMVDRRCQMDLAAAGGFDLELSATAFESIGYLSLYFHSGDGWYAAGKPIPSDQWRTVHFAKASFKTEGDPSGWNRIDRMRIALWRATGKPPSNATIRLRRLVAVWSDVAVVIPDKAKTTSKAESDSRATRDAVAAMLDMLGDLGIDADAVEESALVDEVLAQRRIAVLPYNASLNDQSVETLLRHVEGGGRIVACGFLPPKLATALGFSRPSNVHQDRHGQFTEMQLDAKNVPGLPKTVDQHSSNILVAQPEGFRAGILGYWCDDEGNATNYPAVLLSDRGALVSHVLLFDHHETKKQLLAAIVGHLFPPLWKTMAEATLSQTGHVGHCKSIDELESYVGSFTVDDAVTRNLQSGLAARQTALRHLDAGAFADAMDNAREAHASLVQAYLRIPESPAHEGRAVWNHSGTGAFPGDWERSAKLLAENGFNMVIPNMLWGGLAHYPSEILPQSEIFRKHGDQIEACCAAAKKYGLEVHVWKVDFNLQNAPKDWIERLRRDGRTQVTVQGKPLDWLCPSHPENLKLERESLLEVARKYPVAGLHFDYIRYPGRESCYCDGCRGRFESQTGRKVANWPVDCYSGDLKEEYNTWRCRQITALVESVSREARSIRPDLKLSAAVFGSYPGCRESVAQDWPEWIRSGYLDFVCPMDYTESDAEFAAMAKNQMELVGGKIPVYPGIGATASNTILQADQVAGQIHLARTLGAAGFAVFNLDRGTADSVIPGIGQGAGSQPAKPPHLK